MKKFLKSIDWKFILYSHLLVTLVFGILCLVYQDISILFAGVCMYTFISFLALIQIAVDQAREYLKNC